MSDAIEQQAEVKDTTKDPNEGKTMLDFVKTQALGEKGLDVAKAEGDAQELGKTDEEKAAELEEKKQQEAEEAKHREEELANETPEQKAEREEKERLEEERQQKEQEELERKEKEEKAKGPIPYERFEEVNNKYKVTVEEYEKIKPIAESHNKIVEFCNTNGITQEQFSKALEVQALLNTDPQKALEKLMPIIEAVQGFTGDRLPEDLQKKVDTGKIELSDAREIAKLRAQQQFGTNRFQQYQQIQQQRAQTEFQRAQINAINSWTEGKSKTDPDFKPRAKREDPKGRYEFVYDAVQAMLAERDDKGQLTNPIKSPNDVPALLEKAYQEVVRSLTPLSKKPPTRKPLMQNGSISRNTEVKIENAKSMKEAIQIAASAHGL